MNGTKRPNHLPRLVHTMEIPSNVDPLHVPRPWIRVHRLHKVPHGSQELARTQHRLFNTRQLPRVTVDQPRRVRLHLAPLHMASELGRRRHPHKHRRTTRNLDCLRPRPCLGRVAGGLVSDRVPTGVVPVSDSDGKRKRKAVNTCRELGHYRFWSCSLSVRSGTGTICHSATLFLLVLNLTN